MMEFFSYYVAIAAVGFPLGFFISALLNANKGTTEWNSAYVAGYKDAMQGNPPAPEAHSEFPFKTT